MKRIILFEDAVFADLLPLTYWRTVFELRCGQASLGDRLQRVLGVRPAGLLTRAWIADVAAERSGLPINAAIEPGDVLVNGRWVVDAPDAFEPPPFVGTCERGIAYVSCDEVLARQLGPSVFLDRGRWSELVGSTSHGRAAGRLIQHPWDLVTMTPELLEKDWDPARAEVHGEVHPAAVLTCPKSIRVGKGATVRALAAIDASDGPVIIDEGATIHSHACVHGPAYIGPSSVVLPLSFVHGGTSLGPVCKVGGEVDACVFQGYSNKAHAGFLGHGYVGSWVNIGAETTNSDLKNTYGTVRVPINGQDIDTGLMFFGCILADHVKTGIQQAIPTGAVIGFASNVAGSRILPSFVRSFTWLTDRGFEEGDAARLARTAAKAMERRQMTLTPAEATLFEKLPEIVDYFESRITSQQAVFEAAGSDAVPQYSGPGGR